MGTDLTRVFGGGQPALGPCGARLEVDLERLERPDVEDDATVDTAVAGTAVTSTPDRQLETGVPGGGDHGGDVGDVGHLNDHGRPSIVEHGCEQQPGSLIPFVGWCEDLSRHFLTQPLDVEICVGGLCHV